MELTKNGDSLITVQDTTAAGSDLKRHNTPTHTHFAMHQLRNLLLGQLLSSLVSSLKILVKIDAQSVSRAVQCMHQNVAQIARAPLAFRIFRLFFLSALAPRCDTQTLI